MTSDSSTQQPAFMNRDLPDWTQALLMLKWISMYHCIDQTYSNSKGFNRRTPRKVSTTNLPKLGWRASSRGRSGICFVALQRFKVENIVLKLNYLESFDFNSLPARIPPPFLFLRSKRNTWEFFAALDKFPMRIQITSYWHKPCHIADGRILLGLPGW